MAGITIRIDEVSKSETIRFLHSVARRYRSKAKMRKILRPAATAARAAMKDSLRSQVYARIKSKRKPTGNLLRSPRTFSFPRSWSQHVGPRVGKSQGKRPLADGFYYTFLDFGTKYISARHITDHMIRSSGSRILTIIEAELTKDLGYLVHA